MFVEETNAKGGVFPQTPSTGCASGCRAHGKVPRKISGLRRVQPSLAIFNARWPHHGLAASPIIFASNGRILPSPGLRPQSGFTEIPIGSEVLPGLAEQFQHVGPRSGSAASECHTRPRPFVGILKSEKISSSSIVGTRRLDRDHIIERRDGRHDVVELTVAHVRVDLHIVRDAASGQAEAVDGPFRDVRGPLAERQAFAQRRSSSRSGGCQPSRDRALHRGSRARSACRSPTEAGRRVPNDH